MAYDPEEEINALEEHINALDAEDRVVYALFDSFYDGIKDGIVGWNSGNVGEKIIGGMATSFARRAITGFPSASYNEAMRERQQIHSRRHLRDVGRSYGCTSPQYRRAARDYFDLISDF